MYFIFDTFYWSYVLGIIEERRFIRRFDKHNSRDPQIPPPPKKIQEPQNYMLQKFDMTT